MIRTKIILIILASIIVLVGALYLVSTTILLQSYSAIEESQTVKNITRASSALKNYNDSLNIKLSDWTQWDDTYQYVVDHNVEFEESNLEDSTLVNLEINLIAFMDTKGEVVYGKYVDIENEVELPSEEMLQDILTYTEILSPDGMGGIVKLGDELMVLQSLPIVKSDGSGPSTGTMLFGRTLDTSVMEHFEELTQLDLTLYINNKNLAPEVINEQQELAPGSYLIMPLSEEVIAGYFILKDLRGDTVGTIQVETPRQVYTQGKDTAAIFVAISSVAIMLFGVVILFFLETLLISRFARLSKEVGAISIDNLKNTELSLGKKDEVGQLAQKINHMIDELVRYQKKEEDVILLQKKKNREEKEDNESIRKSLEDKASMNKLMVERELKMVELKKEIQKLKNELENK